MQDNITDSSQQAVALDVGKKHVVEWASDGTKNANGRDRTNGRGSSRAKRPKTRAWKKPSLCWFTPHRTLAETLEELCVHSQIVDYLATDAIDLTDRHYVLVGDSGVGKSHILAVVCARLRSDPNGNFAIVSIDSPVACFAQLLDMIHFSLFGERPENLAGMRNQREVELELERRLFDRVESRELLLIVEDIDRLMSGLPTEDRQQFAQFLTKHPTIRSIASTTNASRLEQLTEIATTITVPRLELSQTERLLTSIASYHGWENTHADELQWSLKVHAIQYASGGNARIVHSFASMLQAHDVDAASETLTQIADRLIPYTCRRLDHCSVIQKSVLQAIGNTGRVDLRRIAEQTRLPEPVVETTVEELLSAGLILSALDCEETVYRLVEPAIRLALDSNSDPRFSGEFLALWLDEKQLHDARPHRQSNALISRAVRFVRENSEPRARLVDATIDQAMAASDEAGVLTSLEFLIAISPTSHSWHRLARYHRQLEKHSEAIDAYKTAIDKSPSDISLVVELAEYLLSLSREHEAIACFDRAIDCNSEDSGLWLRKGWFLFDRKDYACSLECGNRAIELNANLLDAWALKAECLEQLGRFRSAIPCYETILALDPTSLDAWCGKANAFARTEHFDQAIEAYDIALSHAHDHADILVAKGVTYLRMRQIDDAIASFDTALATDQNNPHAWNGKGRALARQEKFPEAMECYGRAVEIDPDFFPAHHNRARLLLNAERFKEARDALQRTLELSPDLTRAHMRLARAEFGLQNWDEGFAQLETFIRDEPKNAWVASETARLIALINRTPARDDLDRNISRVLDVFGLIENAEHFGSALVCSLQHVTESDVHGEQLELIRSVWLEHASKYAPLESSLRIFRVGLLFITSNDRRVLLDLVPAERKQILSLFDIDRECSSVA
ncbi:MAG: tetratricopeptide repeat protein [Planctomycetales bacterium]|nr:tetratricopeptide repeat protein [Planctomycetales bacterium]